MIYFITCREVGMVKIGHTDLVTHRLRTIQVGCPLLVELEATFKGGVERERVLHRRFQADRVRGEWYRITPEIELAMKSPDPAEKPHSELTDAEKLDRLVEENAFALHRAELLAAGPPKRRVREGEAA